MARGFTLLELMVVIAIVSLLTALALPSYQGYLDQARQATLRSAAQSMAVRQALYRAKEGTYSSEGWSPGDGPTETGWAPSKGADAFTYVISAGSDGYAVTVTIPPPARKWSSFTPAHPRASPSSGMRGQGGS